ncbi:MAG: hypothetical protein OHK0039_34440 [Bacteroidia bacterium]
MNAVSKLFSEPNVLHLEELLSDVVNAFNRRRMLVLDQYGVTESDVEIIRYLNEQDQKKMKEVGEVFAIKLSTLTSTVDKLEKLKLVKRRNSKEDRRVIFIKPTTRGQNLLSDLQEITRVVADALVSGSNAQDYDTLKKSLERILSMMKS